MGAIFGTEEDGGDRSNTTTNTPPNRKRKQSGQTEEESPTKKTKPSESEEEREKSGRRKRNTTNEDNEPSRKKKVIENNTDEKTSRIVETDKNPHKREPETTAVDEKDGDEEKPKPVDEVVDEKGGDEEKAKPVAELEEPAEKKDALQVVVRNEIRNMSEGEQMRFVNCVKKLMEGEPGQSEWHRIAGYHGWPTDYCAHRNESFPGWHRAYLKELETALQIADKEIGGDGNIGLPFWDWLDDSHDDYFPAIIRREFPGLPDGFFEDSNHDLARYEFQNASDRKLRNHVKQARLDVRVVNCLLEDEHHKHASASNSRDTSVESPHDQIHVAVGWPMTSVEYAAFNPIFWLHHNNIDRIYTKYLELETDSHDEYQNYQLMREEQGEVNMYEKIYEPFKHPVTGEPFHARDTFRTEPLGYRFEYLPETPAQQMSEMPTLVAWLGVDIVDLKQVSYEIHCFLTTLEEEEVADVDLENEDSWLDHPAHAGLTALFGGKGEMCENCRTTKPVNRTINVAQKLNALGLNRGTAKIHVLTVSTQPLNGQKNVAWYQDLDEEARGVIPEAVFTGPFFESMDELLEEGNNSLQSNKLQEYLKTFGYYGGELDGEFGPKTAAALTQFQKLFGLEVDAVAGPVTKTFMSQARFDNKTDNDGSVATYKAGDLLPFWIGTCPGYLDREAVLQELENAFSEWSEVTNVQFERIENRDDAVIEVCFTDQSRTNPFLFDGAGGVLAKGSKDRLEFDASERWLLQGQEEKRNQFYVLPVAVHEVGHILGLEHSKNMNDVMFPYYQNDRVTLQEGDKERASALYTALEEAVEEN